MKRIQIAPRPDWCSQAESFGFHFHTLEGELGRNRLLSVHPP